MVYAFFVAVGVHPSPVPPSAIRMTVSAIGDVRDVLVPCCFSPQKSQGLKFQTMSAAAIQRSQCTAGYELVEDIRKQENLRKRSQRPQ